jgi:hypothetical protein
MGVNVVETEEASEEEGERVEPEKEAESESGELVEVRQKAPAKTTGGCAPEAHWRSLPAVDDRGHRMTLSHTRKRGVRYTISRTRCCGTAPARRTGLV